MIALHDDVMAIRGRIDVWPYDAGDCAAATIARGARRRAERQSLTGSH